MCNCHWAVNIIIGVVNWDCQVAVINKKKKEWKTERTHLFKDVFKLKLNTSFKRCVHILTAVNIY